MATDKQRQHWLEVKQRALNLLNDTSDEDADFFAAGRKRLHDKVTAEAARERERLKKDREERDSLMQSRLRETGTAEDELKRREFARELHQMHYGKWAQPDPAWGTWRGQPVSDVPVHKRWPRK